MSERWIRTSVGLFDTNHELHPMARQEPACAAFAWQELIALARWKDGGGLLRGQLKLSQRFLSVRWSRSLGWVNRLLQYLAQTGRISRTRNPDHRERSSDVITICNYERYQGASSDTVNANGNTSENTSRHTNGNKVVRHTSTKQTLPSLGNGNGHSGQEWVRPYLTPWVKKFGGEPNVGFLRKKLEPLETAGTRAQTITRWTNFVAGLDPRFMGNGDAFRRALLRFASTPSVYDDADWNLSDRDKAELARLTEGL